jgi:hypothetical protein
LLRATGLVKAQAEGLLGWLEGNGYELRGVALGPGDSRVVHYRPCPKAPVEYRRRWPHGR